MRSAEGLRAAARPDAAGPDHPASRMRRLPCDNRQTSVGEESDITRKHTHTLNTAPRVEMAGLVGCCFGSRMRARAEESLLELDALAAAVKELEQARFLHWKAQDLYKLSPRGMRVTGDAAELDREFPESE